MHSSRHDFYKSHAFQKYMFLFFQRYVLVTYTNRHNRLTRRHIFQGNIKKIDE
jgi:hypothetical protein